MGDQVATGGWTLTYPVTHNAGCGFPQVPQVTPHCCPVCEGRCVVPIGFYSGSERYTASNNIAGDCCRSCTGTGVIWRHAAQ